MNVEILLFSFFFFFFSIELNLCNSQRCIRVFTPKAKGIDWHHFCWVQPAYSFEKFWITWWKYQSFLSKNAYFPILIKIKDFDYPTPIIRQQLEVLGSSTNLLSHSYILVCFPHIVTARFFRYWTWNFWCKADHSLHPYLFIQQIFIENLCSKIWRYSSEQTGMVPALQMLIV